MAEETIPASVSLTSKPKVLRISEMTGRSRHEVVGLLIDLWAWAKRESKGGKLPSAGPARLAALIGADAAFWRAVESVGWLVFAEGGVEIPRAPWLRRKAKAPEQRDLLPAPQDWERALAYAVLRGWVTGDFLEAWAEWVKHRKEIRHPLTERSARLQLEAFKGWTQERAVAAIRHSICQGYRGIYEPRAGKPAGPTFDGLKGFLGGGR